MDVTRKKMRCADKMEPAKTNKVNKMSYVIAIEEGAQALVRVVDELMYSQQMAR